MLTTRDNFTLDSFGVAEGTDANTFQLTRAGDYSINGVSYHKAAANNLPFTAGTALAAKQQCVFFVAIDANGTVSTIQSEIRADITEQSYVQKAIEWPNRTTLAILGAIHVRTTVASTFTPGSTDLSASNVVDAYRDAAGDYSKPIVM
jgi:hypothetical protein